MVRQRVDAVMCGMQINNAGPAAVVVVSCVTKDPPYYPHAHSLVGSSCENGVCTMRVKAGVNTIRSAFYCASTCDACKSRYCFTLPILSVCLMPVLCENE